MKKLIYISLLLLLVASCAKQSPLPTINNLYDITDPENEEDYDDDGITDPENDEDHDDESSNESSN